MSASGSSRRLGLLLIFLVLLVAAVAPNFSTRTVTGTAQAAPVEGPPAIGDCATDPINPDWNNLGVKSATAGTTVSTYAYPTVGISRCQGARYGEITALIPRPTKPLVTMTNSLSGNGTDVTDSNMDTCQLAGYRYVGITLTGGQPTPLLAGWSPLLVIGAAASTPSVRQQAAGQHWLACIVYLTASTEPPPVVDQERYDTSIRNALFTGQERDRVGLCVAAADLNEGETGQIGCATDHQSEIFGLGSTGNRPAARADLQASCRQVVARLTNIDKITAAGLTVSMLATDMTQAPITSDSIPANTALTCGVSTAHHRILSGSLLALGSQPIPWK